MYYPELETLEKMNLDDCNLVPIKKEIYSDMITPIELMRKLKQYSKHVYMLESHEDKSKWGDILLLDLILKVKLHVTTR